MSARDRLIRDPLTPAGELRRAIACLAVEIPGEVWDDVNRKATAVLNEHEPLLDIAEAARRAVSDIERRLSGDASINAPFDEDLALARAALIDALARLDAIRGNA